MAKRILLVDDDEVFLLAVSRLLEAEGYEVLRACGAAEAQSQLEAETPDLILLDVIMPGKDGFTFADDLSQDERFLNIPIVLVTAVAESPGQMMHAFEEEKGLTAVDIVRKSEAHERLPDIVASALGEDNDTE